MSHPYAIQDRLSCCKYYTRKIEAGNVELDGRLIGPEDPEEFCLDFKRMLTNDSRHRMSDNFEHANYVNGTILPKNI